MKMKNVAIIGTGYVGLTIGACLSDIGHKVFCYDTNSIKLEDIKKGNLPIYEKGLDEIVQKNILNKNLNFTNSISVALNNADICFIAVGTPSNADGTVDETAVNEAIVEIAKNITKYTVIVNKSTVPIGSAQKTEKLIKRLTKVPFDVVSNPEFLRQGSAVYDFLNPERVVIGTSSSNALKNMMELYEPLNLAKEKFLITDEKTSEMIKYASNAFLAVKISYINEIASLAEKIGANIDLVSKGMGMDDRIGSKFLKAGIGFGGSCFPKDMKAIVNIAKNNDVELKIISSALSANAIAKENFAQKILSFYNFNVRGKIFAVWGLSFKPETNDLREAPSIDIIEKLFEYGAIIKAYDPKAVQEAKKIFLDKISYSNSKEETLENASALIILTEWEEFKSPDFNLIQEKLKDKIVFDGRNIFEKEKLKSYNLDYICVGKN